MRPCRSAWGGPTAGCGACSRRRRVNWRASNFFRRTSKFGNTLVVHPDGRSGHAESSVTSRPGTEMTTSSDYPTTPGTVVGDLFRSAHRAGHRRWDHRNSGVPDGRHHGGFPGSAQCGHRLLLWLFRAWQPCGPDGGPVRPEIGTFRLCVERIRFRPLGRQAREPGRRVLVARVVRGHRGRCSAAPARTWVRPFSASTGRWRRTWSSAVR